MNRDPWLERLLSTTKPTRGDLLADIVVPAGSQQEYVTAVRVLGDPAVAAARRARGGGRQRPWQVPPALLAKAFDSEAADAAESDAALAAMAARISGDPAQLQGFLSTDPGLIAEALARYDGAPGALAELKGRYPDPRIAGKIDEVLAAMERRRGEAK